MPWVYGGTSVPWSNDGVARSALRFERPWHASALARSGAECLMRGWGVVGVVVGD